MSRQVRRIGRQTFIEESLQAEMTLVVEKLEGEFLRLNWRREPAGAPAVPRGEELAPAPMGAAFRIAAIRESADRVPPAYLIARVGPKYFQVLLQHFDVVDEGAAVGHGVVVIELNAEDRLAFQGCVRPLLLSRALRARAGLE